MSVSSKLPTLAPKETAAAVRKILKAAFPATKFSVTTNRGSMVSSISIHWTDGPTVARVDALVAGFESGHFDSMTDCYEYDRTRALVVEGVAYRPGCRYVQTSRTTSLAFARRAAEQVAAYYGVAVPTIGENKWGGWAVENDLSAHQFSSYEWSTLIYQATTDRTRYAMEAR